LFLWVEILTTEQTEHHRVFLKFIFCVQLIQEGDFIKSGFSIGKSALWADNL